MRNIVMNERELERAEILQRVISNNITLRQAARQMNISLRQARRQLRKVEAHGIAGLAHQSRGRSSGRRLQGDIARQIRALLHSRYSDFGATFAAEKLGEEYGIRVSREKIRQMQIAEGLWKPKRRRDSRCHSRRLRRSRYGELIQIDGSPHDWLEGRGPRLCLINFIDDATSRIQYARFVKAETTEEYMRGVQVYAQRYGLPLSFYSDKHSIFRINVQDARERGEYTQLGQALRRLDVELICAHSPQAKGRVERSFGVLQDRLVKEMRLKGIDNLEEANRFLEAYLRVYNQKFSMPPISKEDAHRILQKDLDLNVILSKEEQRTLSKDLSFQYKCTSYQVVAPHSVNRLQKQRILVIETLSGEIMVKTKAGKILEVRPYETFNQPCQITMGDKELEAATWSNRRAHKPAKHHPWR